MKILITGFEPFGSLKANTSKELVLSLLKEKFEFELVGEILPVCFSGAFESLEQVINEQMPGYVVSFGVAKSRTAITPELIAVNYKKSNLPDNSGVMPKGEKVLEDSADGLFSGLPIEQMVAASLAVGVEAEVSSTAGTYVCNDLMYKLIKFSRSEGFKAGFVHIPSLESSFNNKLSLPSLERGVTEMLNFIGLQKSP